LAAAKDDGTVSLLNIANHKLIGRPLEGHSGGVYRMAFRPDGKVLASIGDDKTLKQWDVATHELIEPPVTFQYFGHTRLAFSPDGGTLVVGERLWDIEKHQIIGGSLAGC
jgi:WD40 repeat protein